LHLEQPPELTEENLEEAIMQGVGYESTEKHEIRTFYKNIVDFEAHIQFRFLLNGDIGR